MQWLFVPHIWDISPEDAGLVENAGIGDTVHIEEPLVPVVFQVEEEFSLFAFSAESEIPGSYTAKYAMVKTSPERIVAEMMAVAATLGKTPLLLLDPFSDNCREITMEQLEKMK